MPRRPRIHLDGIPLHIVQRGHNRQPCFLAAADYLTYLEALADAALSTGCQIHAYVMMANHVHLLLTPAQAQSASRLMVAVGRRFVPYINAQYQRCGTLWEGRYKSSVMDSEAYLLTCMRYIELNPVRAGMCTDPAHYRWSSYRTTALGEPSPLIRPHALYTGLGDDDSARQTAYRSMFATPLGDATLASIRLALNQAQPLGRPPFLDAVEQATGQRREARPRGRPRKLAAPAAERHDAGPLDKGAGAD